MIFKLFLSRSHFHILIPNTYLYGIFLVDYISRKTKNHCQFCCTYGYCTYSKSHCCCPATLPAKETPPVNGAAAIPPIKAKAPTPIAVFLAVFAFLFLERIVFANSLAYGPSIRIEVVLFLTASCYSSFVLTTIIIFPIKIATNLVHGLLYILSRKAQLFCYLFEIQFFSQSNFIFCFQDINSFF